MSVRWRRWSLWLALLAVVVVAAATPALRDPILRRFGWVLVVDEAIAPADVIVVPVWAGRSGAIEAADLVHARIASRVALLAEPISPADAELNRRSVHFDDDAADLLQLLRALGVEAVEVIPATANGTEAEGRMLPSWCDERQFRSAIVVSNPEHSRRVRRVLRRSMSGHQTTVTIRSTRFALFDADRWWQSRDSLRLAIVELPKLLFDVVRHPFS